MTELNDMLAELRNLEADAVSPGQVERTIRLGNQRYRRQQRTRVGALVVAAMVIAGVAGTLTYRLHARSNALTLTDGSHVIPLDTNSEVAVLRTTPELVEVAARAGETRFDVAHDPKRKFHVVAGDVHVEVIGTRFVVAFDAEGVNVRVERGRVRVSRGADERFLDAGQAVAFARQPDQVPPASPVGQETPPAPSAMPDTREPSAPSGHDATRVRKTEKSEAANAWRASAAKGNYETAYGELRAGGAKVVRDVPEELMLAADVARWSKHPAEAVPYLERVVREHKADPRSQLAAFTLGRVLLDELGRPREAANAFARSRALDPDGPLAGDALAREVEAWSRAGDNANVLARAEEYLARYPQGPHAASVRRFGRLE